MARCIMGHGSEGYCEHCPGDAGEGTSDKRAAVAVSHPRGWEYADTSTEGDEWLPAAEDDDSREELRVLDASLSLDAELCAGVAVREFAESVDTDVRYALKQCVGLLGFTQSPWANDCARRAMDALERVVGRIEAVTAECAGV